MKTAVQKYTPDEILDLCAANLSRAKSAHDVMMIRMAGRFAWQEKEMGGIEYVQFAYRNDTPIVPPNHEAHPINLLRRGFIDGVGWPKEGERRPYTITRWPDGEHYYVKHDDGTDITDGATVKWDTWGDADMAAQKWVAKKSAAT